MTHVLRPLETEALADWVGLVEANRAQVDHLREWEDPYDFYGPTAEQFRADPDRTDDVMLNALRALAAPDQTWLDGAGGGRFTLGVAREVQRIIAIELSEGMRTVLAETAREHGITNLDVIGARWPELPDAPPIHGDSAMITHVSYDIDAIGPFLTALEEAAPRCVAVLLVAPPPAIFDPLWPAVHGELAVRLPALPEFVALLFARGVVPSVQVWGRWSRAFDRLSRRKPWRCAISG